MGKRLKTMVEDEVCGTCAHYYQHFVIGDRLHLVPLWYGHCGLRMSMKDRNPAETCPGWEARKEK